MTTAPDLPGGFALTGTLLERMGIEIVSASAERVVGRMPVEGNTQPYGLLHGGASCVLVESLGSVGSAIHAGEGRIEQCFTNNAYNPDGGTHQSGFTVSQCMCGPCSCSRA